MGLESFMQLSDDEIKQEAIISALLAFDELDISNLALISPEKINDIINCKVTTLIKLALANPDLDLVLKSIPQLTTYWNTIWSQFHNCGFKPISSINTFDLIKGMYLYWEYLALKASSDNSATEFLIAAAELGCFPAIDNICKYYLQQSKSTPNDSFSLQIIKFATKAANLYGSPGYLLLSQCYLQLAQQQSTTSTKTQTILNTKKAFYYKQAYIASVMAVNLESNSSAEIHNAYEGLSIAIYYNNKIINFSDFSNKLSRHSLISENMSELTEAVNTILRTTHNNNEYSTTASCP